MAWSEQDKRYTRSWSNPVAPVRVYEWVNVAQVVRSLRALNLDHAPFSDEIKRTPAYFDSNRERMRYDAFRALGYPIGSGTVEKWCQARRAASIETSWLWLEP
jgi:hypothetical protein